jgi:glycosyltransferase involved in cell wall biosynthesis
VVARPELIALLPVRNAERWLPDWLVAASEWADGVIALDDGSTDASASILGAHPLVRRILRNPTRPTFEGWDDRANRQRLLDAAAEFSPKWVIFLDADERIAPSDVGLLSQLTREEDPGFAYGFRIHAATDDLSLIEPEGRWVYRLFGWQQGMELPDKKLHLVPIPLSIPRRRWLRTTVRVLHLGTTADTDRAARFNKYEQADPDRRWQASYDHLLDQPEGMAPLTPLDGNERAVLPVHQGSGSNPALSAIVISRGDEPELVAAVASVVAQRVPGGHEVIVVISDSPLGAARIRTSYPGLQVIELAEPALPGAARIAGLAVARGDFVAFPSSHILLPEGSLAARVRSHSEGWAMVTGPVLNGNATTAGWASYFLDHSTLLPDRPSGELSHAPTRCSYVRFLLDEVGGFPEDRRAGEDTVVNTKLWRRDFSAYRDQDAAAIHLSPCSTAGRLVSHHYARGRAWAQILLESNGNRRRVLFRRGWALALYVPRRLVRIGRNVRANGRGLIQPYRRSYPLIVLGALAAFWGIVVGLGAGGVGAATDR